MNNRAVARTTNAASKLMPGQLEEDDFNA